MAWYAAFVLAVGLERLAELFVSTRNARAAFARGGVESGRGHYPVMVVVHVGLLLGCLVEPVVAHRPFLPAVGWPLVAVVLATQTLRWWCIASLRERWNTRVIVIPGLPPVSRGPYRWLRHPNYLAVVAEGLALPLVRSAWLTAGAFAVLNAVILRVRIRCENAALRAA